MSKKPATRQKVTDPRRTPERRGPFYPKPASDELDIPLPLSLERYRDNLMTVLFDGSLTPADKRQLVRSARRDSIRRAITKVTGLPGDSSFVTSPTIRQLQSQAVLDASTNARHALAERVQIATAINVREQALASLAAHEPAGAASSPVADAAAPKAPDGSEPAYKVRRAARQARAAAAAAAQATSEAASRRCAVIERLSQELTELRRLDEQLHLDSILSTLAARYENQARFYLMRAHLPRELRTLKPEPLTARDLYRELSSGCTGSWMGVSPAFDIMGTTGTATDGTGAPESDDARSHLSRKD